MEGKDLMRSIKCSCLLYFSISALKQRETKQNIRATLILCICKIGQTNAKPQQDRNESLQQTISVMEEKSGQRCDGWIASAILYEQVMIYYYIKVDS